MIPPAPARNVQSDPISGRLDNKLRKNGNMVKFHKETQARPAAAFRARAGWTRRKLCAALGAGLLALNAAAQSGLIPVPNGSFEAPDTDFADPRIDRWQEMPKPEWYDESTQGPWSQLTGVFQGTPPGAEDHIDNMDGEQALFLFAVPGAGVFLDANAVDWTGTPPAEPFAPQYEPFKAYELTVGLIGGGYGMLEGVPITLQLYYLAETGEHVPVASTEVIYSKALFPDTRTHFLDFSVRTPTIWPDSPAAGRPIGIALISTVPFELAGGFWDVDNVRLREISGPKITQPTVVGDQFIFDLLGEPETTYRVLAAPSPDTPSGQWENVAELMTDTAGKASFSEKLSAERSRFYRLEQVL